MISNGMKPIVRLPQLKLICLASRRTFVNSSLERVPALYPNLYPQHDLHIRLPIIATSYVVRRSYAGRPVSRPKAHTGRVTTTARKAPTTKATKAAKEPAPRTKAAKAVPKAKATVKPRIKPKPKPKKKAKAKPTPKKRKLTEKGKQRKARHDLSEKAKALKVTALDGPPSAGQTTAYSAVMAEVRASQMAQGLKDVAGHAKIAGAKYRQLTPEQLEHYNHIANQNKAVHNKAYRQWVESYTPDQIYRANLARQQLKRMGTKKAVAPLHDDRLVKGLRSSYLWFSRERQQSGDFKGLKLSEAARLTGREWKALSAEEKKPYIERAAEDHSRYAQELKTVYNRDITSSKK